MHLRMFDAWLQQFDTMKQQQKFVEAGSGAGLRPLGTAAEACESSVSALARQNQLPLIPDMELAKLERGCRLRKPLDP